MAALTAPRDTREMAPGKFITLEVASGNTIYAGGLVAINASGKAVPAADATGLLVVGIAQETVGEGHNVKIQRKGVFLLDNDTTNPIAIADYGKPAYVVDDHTVSDTAGSYAVVAGRIVGMEGTQVRVELEFAAAEIPAPDASNSPSASH